MIALQASLFTQLLREVGHARMQVTGCSMLPAIVPGDVIRVESAPAQVGDIVVFNRDGHLCAHRLLAIVDGRIVARGDANRKLDLPIEPEEVLGKVTSLVRQEVETTDLRYRPILSFIIRSFYLAPRIYLKAQSLYSRLFGPQQRLTPTSTNIEA